METKKQVPKERTGEIFINPPKKNKKPKLNEMEASKLPDTEFKTVLIRMLKELSETFKKQ